MKRLTLILALALPLMAQPKPAAPKPSRAATPEIRAEDQAEDPPEFRRKYFTNLTSKPGLSITLECKYDHIFDERNCTATIRQPDERAVSFTVGGRYAAYDSIADKIIDPVIVPEVKRLAAEMHLQDVKFMAANPSEFKTKDGNRWSKVRQ